MQMTSDFTISAVKPRNGKLFDFTRNVARADRPEERVRLGALKALHDVYGFRREQISTEAALWEKKSYRFRADVVLWEDDERARALAVIETKAGSVGLTAEMREKLIRYAACFDPRPHLLVLTNGVESAVFRGSDLRELSRFPTALQAANGFEGLPVVPLLAPFRRPSRSVFRADAAEVRQRLRQLLGVRVSDQMVSVDAKRAYVALGEMLRDDSHDLAAYRPKFAGYTLTEDRGVRWTSFGNASGGRFYGLYRHVLLRTPRGQMKNCCFAVSTYAKRPDAAPSSLALVGGLEGRQSLQLQSSVGGCSFSDSSATLVHRGHISLGEGGRISGEKVREVVRKRLPGILDDSRIVAARLSPTIATDVEARRTVVRLAALTHVLDELRSRVRAERR